jgi:hypothetical protein
VTRMSFGVRQPGRARIGSAAARTPSDSAIEGEAFPGASAAYTPPASKATPQNRTQRAIGAQIVFIV